MFYNLGVNPEFILRKRLELRLVKYGGIIVDNNMKTNIPNIWAAGDCVETKNLVTGKQDYFSLGSLSNRMGRVAADSIAGKEVHLRCCRNISLKVFDLLFPQQD